ncbi:MAG: hypothetical protein ABR880_21310 [Candidatus Sulfotelmatobacter sp.]|jgi:hypothetical protein
MKSKMIVTPWKPPKKKVKPLNPEMGIQDEERAVTPAERRRHHQIGIQRTLGEDS